MIRQGLTIGLLLTLATSAGLRAQDYPEQVQEELLPEGALQRLGSLVFVYPDGIGDLCYLPDGRALIAVGSTLETWSMARTMKQRETPLPVDNVPSLHVNSAGTRVLIGAADGTVLELSLEDYTVVRQIKTGYGSLRRALYSPDEGRVLTTYSRPPRICEWRLASGAKSIDIEGDMHYFHEAIYSADGRRAYVNGGNGSGPVLAEYNLGDGSLVAAWHKDYYTHARSLVLSADGERLLLGSRHMATEWRLRDRKLLRKFTGHHGHAVTAVEYGGDPDTLMTGSRDGSIRLWNRLDGEVLLRWFPHNSYVSRIHLSPEGRWVLSYGSGTVAECSIETGLSRYQWQRHTDAVQDVVWLDGTDQVISVSSDGTAKRWNTGDGTCLTTVKVEGGGAYCVDHSPDRQRVAVGCKDGRVREFSVEDGTPVRTLEGHRGYVRDLVYTDRGQIFSAAGDGSVRIWPGQSTPDVTVLTGHQGGVLAVASSADGQRIATGGRDGTVRIWDETSGSQRHLLKGHDSWVSSVEFIGQNRVLSAGLDGRIIVWDAATGQRAWDAVADSPVLGAAGDGETHVFCGHSDGTLSAWNLVTGEPLSTRYAHANGVAALAVSPDHTRVVSAGLDGSLLVWERDALLRP